MRFTDKSKGRRSAKRALLLVLLLAALTGAALLGKMALDELTERRKGAVFYEQLAEAGETATVSPTKTLASNTVVGGSTEDPEPEVPSSQIDFDTLRQTCPDIVGWLRIEDTEIDFPVVQGEDNDFYLHHLADQTPNSAGSVMMNCTNDPTFKDDVTILHGHHMRNDTMFSHLDSYSSEEYYLRHRTIRLFTPAGDFDVAVFAAYTVNGYSFDYVSSFADKTAFETFIRSAKVSTGYETDVEVEFGDRLLMLSTCAYSFEGARFVVIGKIIE